MKKPILIAAIILVAGLFGFGAYNLSNQVQPADNSQQTAQQQTQQPAGDIDFSEDGKTVTYDGVEGETALATLKELTDVQTEESEFGEFVSSINGVKADSAKEYWSFYVNDKYADEGAGTYKAKAGDKFKWQLEQLQ